MKVQYRGVPVKIPMTKIIIEVRLGSTQCVHISFRYNMLKKKKKTTTYSLKINILK